MTQIGVGIIGASPGRSWAALSHVPALKALPDFDLRAVSTSRRESAEAAAVAFETTGFDNHEDLLAHPGVDLVVVAVKVPRHEELITAALAAGKMVYSEWPLGVDARQAARLAAQARTSGVRTVVGLQGRFSPAIEHARELVHQGYIGEVLGTTLEGSGMGWGPDTTASSAYVYDAASGATTLSVVGMHALDAVTWVLGDFSSVGGALAVRRPYVRVADSGEMIPVTAPDHVAISGRLGDGAIASAYFRGGTSRAGNLRWQINGTDGDLLITSGGNLQVAELALYGARGAETELVPIAVPTESLAGGGALAGNVARLYRQFADDIMNDTNLAPDFAYAVTRHEVLNAIETSAVTGVAVHPRTDGKFHD
ncbi:Gfo/Idh/MocA family oxidoreductase [Herbiconiux sp. CPCC 205763]|uniref:Gfo/Idh/MocA family oxidoreductase n=1 Tax=Herbiconiux aconitum TaxID=2970913 RepID=A0ABT2GNC5_9MICO|nr:Gfo/Idh/MocA family oxidoreductase [Herbiconiux aconitum]MCS5717708.1 Gfo/Idh/MocA family oxidoreductase [Herbiconiux aconitum]